METDLYKSNKINNPILLIQFWENVAVLDSSCSTFIEWSKVLVQYVQTLPYKKYCSTYLRYFLIIRLFLNYFWIVFPIKLKTCS